MISSHLGHFLDKPLIPLAKKININPNIITVIGFVITAAAAVSLPFHLRTGGVLILIGGLFDMLDGVIARANGRTSDFGAFLDSVLDRYSDSFLFIGFGWYFLKTGSAAGLFLSAGTLVSTLIISYTKARAEGLGKDCHTGLMERAERIILMIFGALTGAILPVMWLLFFLTHITVAQRVHHVWKLMK